MVLKERPLSIGMIRALHRGLGIPTEVLLRKPQGCKLTSKINNRQSEISSDK